MTLSNGGAYLSTFALRLHGVILMVLS